jgi:hypothetical protein
MSHAARRTSLARYLNSPGASAWLLSPEPVACITAKTLQSAVAYSISTNANLSNGHPALSLDIEGTYLTTLHFCSLLAPEPWPLLLTLLLAIPPPVSSPLTSLDVLATIATTTDNIELGVIYGLSVPHVFAHTPLMSGAFPKTRRMAIDLACSDPLELVEVCHFDNCAVAVIVRRYHRTIAHDMPLIGYAALHVGVDLNRASARLAGASSFQDIFGPPALTAEFYEASSCIVCGAGDCVRMLLEKSPSGRMRITMRADAPPPASTPRVVYERESLIVNVVMGGEGEYQDMIRRRTVHGLGLSVTSSPNLDPRHLCQPRVHMAYLAPYSPYLPPCRPLDATEEAQKPTFSFDSSDDEAASAVWIQSNRGVAVPVVLPKARRSRYVEPHLALMEGVYEDAVPGFGSNQTACYANASAVNIAPPLQTFPLPTAEPCFGPLECSCSAVATDDALETRSALPWMQSDQYRQFGGEDCGIGELKYSEPEIWHPVTGELSMPDRPIAPPTVTPSVVMSASTVAMPIAPGLTLASSGSNGDVPTSTSLGGKREDFCSVDVVDSFVEEIEMANITGGNDVVEYTISMEDGLDNERRFSCSLCSSRFKLRTDMMRHIARIHGKERNFVCPICERAFGVRVHVSRWTG